MLTGTILGYRDRASDRRCALCMTLATLNVLLKEIVGRVEQTVDSLVISLHIRLGLGKGSDTGFLCNEWAAGQYVGPT
jgi:hypothetical protein